MKDLIVIENNKPILASRMVDNLIDIEKKIKELKAIQDGYKKTIKEAMEAKGVIKIADEITGLSISYIAEQTVSLLPEENPDLYDKYVTMDGKKSAYITIRTK